MDSQPILSICIPTYNRVSLLKETLVRLETGLKRTGALSDVEVVIGNNCSTDGTAELLNTYAARGSFPHLKVTNRLENIGPDRNFLAVLEEATGLYCWLVSDDDVVVDTAIPRLIESLRVNQPTFVVINIEGWEDASKLIKVKDSPCKNMDHLCNEVGAWLTFLSIMILRRERMSSLEYPAYAKTNLLQSHIFLDVASKGEGIFYTSSPLIRFRPGQSGGYSFLKVFVSNFLALLDFARSRGLSDPAYQKVVYKHLLGYVLMFVVRTRAFGKTGQFSMPKKDSFRQIWNVLVQYPRFVIPLLLIMVAATLPSGLLHWLLTPASYFRSIMRRSVPPA